MRRYSRKRFRARRFRRRGRKSRRVGSSLSYYRRLWSKIQRSITERVFRSTQEGIISTSTTTANVPIVVGTFTPLWDSTYNVAVLTDTGVDGALGDATDTNSRWSLYGLRANHTFRNVALNPCFLDVYIYTLNNTSYASTTTGAYDTIREQFMADVYSGWVAKFTGGDINANVLQSNGTTAWAGTTDPYYCKSKHWVPTLSKDVNSRFKRLKQYRVMLNPGQSFNFTDKAKPLFGWNPAADKVAATLGRPHTTRMLVWRAYGSVGVSSDGSSQGYCPVKLVYQADIIGRVCNEQLGQSQQGAFTTPGLPASTTTVNGVGDDAVVS